MTATASMYTTASAFAAAEKAFLGENRVWKSMNAMQGQFIDEILGLCRPDLPKIPELESVVALTEEPINAFLRERKFGIQLDKFPQLSLPERAWGAAGALDLLLKWKNKGKKTEITTLDKRRFPAAKLPNSGISLFHVSGHSHPISGIYTDSTDVAFMTICDEALEHFDLLNKVDWLSRNKRLGAPYEGLIFPMVDLDHKVNVGWLKGMWTIDDEGYFNKITQALQQTKLKMNHKGVRIKDAAAIGGVRTTSVHMPLPPMVIDRPFLFWVERFGFALPLFAGYITEESWKDPGSLDM